MKPGIVEALALVAKIRALSKSLARDEDGQDARWQMLQDWLANNPQYKQLIARCLKQSPAQALETICNEMNIEPILIQAIDRDGQVQAMAINTIETIQNLYNERAAIAQGEIVQ
jgi:hypothetical protein